MLDYICKKIIMKEIIESVWENRKLLENPNNSNAVLKTIELLDKGLPPQNCKKAEHETVFKLRSKPIKKS